MADDQVDEAVFDVLGSEEARAILGTAGAAPATAEELAEACGASLPTVYRRVNDLEEHGLLRSDTRIDPDGNHYQTYETAVRRVSLSVGDGGVSVEVDRDRDMVDRFEAFWSDLERHSMESRDSGAGGGEEGDQ